MSEPVHIDLRAFGYAPGSYEGKCQKCEQEFVGNKWAWSCEPCARRAFQADEWEKAKPPEVSLDPTAYAGSRAVEVANAYADELLRMLKPLTCGQLAADNGYEIAVACSSAPTNGTLRIVWISWFEDAGGMPCTAVEAHAQHLRSREDLEAVAKWLRFEEGAARPYFSSFRLSAEDRERLQMVVRGGDGG